MADITSPIMLDSTGQGIITALGQIKDAVTGPSAADVTYDGTVSGLSADDVQEAIDELASEKQDTLTFDASPTDNSSNPVTSDGVYEAIKDIVGWGVNDNVDIPTPFVDGLLSWDDSADTIGVNTNYITSPYIPIREDVITFSAIKGNIVRIYYTDENHNKIYFIGNAPINGNTLTIQKKDGAKYIRFSIGGIETVTYTDYGTKLKANIVYGSEPYHASVDESKANSSALGTVENNDTASKAYAIGEHFSRFGDFCTVTQPIASGGLLTETTNYVVGSIGDELSKNPTSSTITATLSNISISSSYNKVYKVGNVVSFKIRITVNTAITNDADKALFSVPYTPVLTNQVFQVFSANAPWASAGFSAYLTTSKNMIVKANIPTGSYDIHGIYVTTD